MPSFVIEELIIRLQEFNRGVGALKSYIRLGEQMIIKTTPGSDYSSDDFVELSVAYYLRSLPARKLSYSPGCDIYTKTIKDVVFKQVNLTDKPTYFAYDTTANAQRQQPILQAKIHNSY